MGNNQITANEEGDKQKIRVNLNIKSTYDSISDEVISNLIEWFPSRLQQWIENELKGFHINIKIYYIFYISHYLSQFFWYLSLFFD